MRTVDFVGHDVIISDYPRKLISFQDYRRSCQVVA